MAQQFKVGDVVRMKSGGPLMTVTKAGTDHEGGYAVLWTVWFNAEQKESNGYYPAATVVLEGTDSDED